MATTEHVEVELKFDVTAGRTPPDLRVLPGVVSAAVPETFSLDATYFDTENLDLATNRITLRRREGGPDAGWHLKLPGDGLGRRERRVGFDEAPADGDVPRELLIPVLALTRTRRLIPVAAIATSRTVTALSGAESAPIAEFCEDLVTAQSLLPDGEGRQWAEWEFELTGDVEKGGRLLKAARKLLRDAGGREPASESKLARAIGSTPALAQPHLGPRPTALDLVVTAIAEQRNAMIAQDPLVRADAEDAVHQMRVATRKLRSVLTGFPGVVEAGRIDHLNSELRLLARVLGDARDSEVQLSLDAELLADEPASPALVAALAGEETAVHDRAIRVAHRALDSDRYFALLDAIDEFLADPPAGPDADQPATKAVDGAVARGRKSIHKAQKDLTRLPEGSPEWVDQLHTIRKRAKRLRYRLDVAGPVATKKHRTVSKAAKRIQSTLGDFHDVAINRARIAEIADSSAPLTPRDRFVLGRIDAREQAREEDSLRDYRAATRDL